MMFGPTVQKRSHLRICGDISEVALPEEPELESESSAQADESSGSANPGCGGPESPSMGSTGGDGASPYCGSDVLAHSYPVPVVVKNTFIDLTPSRPVSLDGFFAERATVSAPGSGLEPGARPAEGSNLDDKMHRKTPDWSVLSPWSNCEGSPVFEHPNAMPQTPGIWATNPPVVGVPLTSPPSHAAPIPPVPAPAIPAPPKIPAPPGAPPAVWPSNQDPPTAPPPGEAGEDLLPSAGSAGHTAGNCKPCAFYHTKGCVSGRDCSFCHLCTEGEKKRRARDKREERKERRARQEEKAASVSGSPHGGASSQSGGAGGAGGGGGTWFSRR
mmetsp:Transcript_17441/g.37325  ORF Transcript_17441/g.37325 Transcript_17441/m.37325 type:complete len:329 (+) Transcript_17441:100-1086(+)